MNVLRLFPLNSRNTDFPFKDYCNTFISPGRTNTAGFFIVKGQRQKWLKTIFPLRKQSKQIHVYCVFAPDNGRVHDSSIAINTGDANAVCGMNTYGTYQHLLRNVTYVCRYIWDNNRSPWTICTQKKYKSHWQQQQRDKGWTLTWQRNMNHFC